MVRRRHWTLIALFTIVAASAAGAETLAVTVRLAAAPEDEPGITELVADVEEGAMDAMFATGHIVFDIDPVGTSDSSWLGAITTARRGGATSLIVIDVSYALVGERGLLPRDATVMIVDVVQESDRLLDRINALTLAGAESQTAEALSLSLGREAALLALAEIVEGTTP